MKKIIYIFAFLVSSSCIYAAEEVLDKIIVVVENEVITSNELAQNITKTKKILKQTNTREPDHNVLAAQILQQMITRKLKLQEGGKMGIFIDEITLDRALKSIAEKNGLSSIQDLKFMIEREGKNFRDIRKEIREELILNRLLQREVIDKIEISEQDINNYLSENNESTEQELEYQFAYFKVYPLLESNKQKIKSNLLNMKKMLSKEGITSYSNLKKRVHDLWEEFYPLDTEKLENQRIDFKFIKMKWQQIQKLPSPVRKRIKGMSASEIMPPMINRTAAYLFFLLDLRGNNQDMMQTQYHVRHILLKTNPIDDDAKIIRRLNRMKEYIKQGGDFTSVAKKHSADPGSSFKGGDLGWSSLQGFDVNFVAAAKAAHEKEEIHGPVKSAFGWHLIEVIGKREENVGNKILRDEAYSNIKKQKLAKEAHLWILRLREENHIKIIGL